MEPPPPAPRKGRGSIANRTSTRFNLPERTADGDWLDAAEAIDGIAPLRTIVTLETPRTIIARNTSPDIPFDRSINPYRGCEHGCVYCYARPTHAFLDLSPGLDFESRLFAKPDAARLLREELGKKRYSPSPIALGTNTDPYQPIEEKWRVTRAILEVLAETRHPFTITTKSDRIVRDLDLLAPLARDRLVAVAISVTTLDPELHRKLEPRAPRPANRIAVLKALSEAGVPSHVNVAPVIPAINDHEIEHILEEARAAGAVTASFIPVRLPNEVAPMFQDWLNTHYPDRAAKVMAQIHSIRGGRDNDPRFFNRMRGSSPWAELIRARFRIACARLGFNRERVELRCDLFRRPNVGKEQFGLF